MLLFLVAASTPSAELVGFVAPAFPWSANKVFWWIDVSLVGGQLSRSGGTSMGESTSYLSISHRCSSAIAYSPGYPSICSEFVRIGDEKMDHSNPSSSTMSRRSLWGGESLSDSGVG